MPYVITSYETLFDFIAFLHKHAWDIVRPSLFYYIPKVIDYISYRMKSRLSSLTWSFLLLTSNKSLWICFSHLHRNHTSFNGYNDVIFDMQMITQSPSMSATNEHGIEANYYFFRSDENNLIINENGYYVMLMK